MNRIARIAAFLLGATLLTILIVHSGPLALWHTISSSQVAVPLVAPGAWSTPATRGRGCC